MIIKALDYAGNTTDIDLEIESIDEIELIYVRVVTGDETGFVYLKNGDYEFFDTNSSRRMDFYDGEYILNKPDEIKEWINYVELGGTNSYKRMQ